mmetsp:Transcript_28306/g.60346  ORF Transcript_28306/g.60346 Transcript_28306/m.60346 type:complete len:434 (-) Transcript_28306:357-1658(-)|eukprot:CAMPEP_0172302748 /NCGR_PEP_ID=MMETSP1058-20130122/4407_1 /TAXON_ID=83371 /ORGANISM="Detonula confervacea, Strain CCMP 353" /LENGTH=433 /DNA_ID=CAMNT_0013013343 /DNA_START=91 /DNA_END=1392 /DNA_ORIENTATION=+
MPDTIIAEKMSPTNEELYLLLEQAAESATGKDDLDIAEFIMILEDEWITDVDALRRLDGDALDELLPLLLSRELQRLMHHDDGRTHFNRNRRWRRSPPIKKRSGSKPRKSPARDKEDHEHSAPPGAVPISEEESSSSSSVSKDDQSGIIEPRPFSSVRLVPQKPKPKHANKALRASAVYDKQCIISRRKKKSPFFFKLFDLLDHWCSCSSKYDEESNEILLDPGEGIDDDDLQLMSNSNPFMADATERANHLIADASRKANIIARARKKFPTREALEDAIREYQAVLEQEQEDATASYSGSHDVQKKLISSTEDELRMLYPIRLILPTIGDLTEMIGMLQSNRECAMRDLNMDKADGMQREISDLQSQIDNEERYLLKKRWEELECVACGEIFTPTPSSRLRRKLVGDGSGGITTKTTERHCVKCREVFDYDV